MRIEPLELIKITLTAGLIITAQLNAARLAEVNLTGSGVEIGELGIPSPSPLFGEIALSPENYSRPFDAFSNSNTIRVKVFSMIGNDEIEAFRKTGLKPISEKNEYEFRFYTDDRTLVGQDGGFGWATANSGKILTGPGVFELEYDNDVIWIWAAHIGSIKPDPRNWVWAQQTLKANLTSASYHVPDSSGPAALFSVVVLFAFHAKYRRKRNASKQLPSGIN